MSDNTRVRRLRRPTLRSAIEAAEKAGKKVKSATIEDGKVTLVFANGEITTDDWDMHLKELDCGKS